MWLFRILKDTHKPYRRRNYFINRKMQGWFTVYFLILGLSVSFVSSFVMWYFSSAKLEEYIFRSHVPPVLPWDVLFPDLIINLLVSTGILVISTYIVAHLVLRKIPLKLKSLKVAMDRIGTGDLATRVPEGGIENLNETLNQYRERLRKKIVSLDRIKTEMDAALSNQSSTENKRKDLDRLCRTFQIELGEIRGKDSEG